MDLFVGRAFFDLNDKAIVRYLLSGGADRLTISQINRADELARFDLLNCITLFTDHVIDLEGYSDRDAGYRAMSEGRFRLKQIPAWEESNWMPFEFWHPGLMAPDSITWVGSCPALLRELEDIAKRSPLNLSQLPPHYVLKPRGPDLSFDGTKLSDAELTRWVWRCFHDAAQLAIRENSVLSGTPE